jgi:hypothetical protein
MNEEQRQNGRCHKSGQSKPAQNKISTPSQTKTRKKFSKTDPVS